MKKFFLALVALAMVPALYAADDTPYRNVCDSLSLGDQPVIELVPAYIEESNWYGNPHTWAKDSSNSTRHESYRTVTVSAKSFANKLPLSISAECRERRGTEFKYATWNNSKQWKENSEDGIATYIFDIHNMKLDGYDSTNTYNLLGMAPAKIPEDNSYNSGYMLASKTFEFAFEWWFVGLTHEFVFDTVIDGNTYGATGRSYSSSIGMDSLHVFEVARNAMNFSQPTRTIRSEYVRVQALKVVLVDSRKPLLPESSSSNPPASSSSEGKSSSSETPVVSSSSETPGPTSSEEKSSSSHGMDESSSSVGTSSSTEPETSSSAEPGNVFVRRCTRKFFFGNRTCVQFFRGFYASCDRSRPGCNGPRGAGPYPRRLYREEFRYARSGRLLHEIFRRQVAQDCRVAQVGCNRCS